MKIESLRVTNFRGVRSASLSDLQSMVIVAGQNGSGKSCLLDSIRLLKSVYGGYQHNEWHQWMGEFQVSFSNQDDLRLLFNNPASELRITCEFTLHSLERQYLIDNAAALVRQSVIRKISPELYSWRALDVLSLAMRGREAEIAEKTSQQLTLFKSELAAPGTVKGEFFIPPGEEARIHTSTVLEVIFGTFRPHHLGVIDYHGPHRTYARETLQGINLNLDAIEQQRSQHALYNYANKYANVKSEMAASFIKDMLARQAGQGNGGQQSLASTLQELFRTFFPEKEFLGPQPTNAGTLLFPVRTADGATHDLNELSAGEKEVLYGYLRLRNSAPRFSVVLLDEPELHLNPRLIKGLPAFYRKHLGSALDNQLWLITHSYTLLREVVGQEGYSVFHMQTATSTTQQQAVPLLAKEGLQRAVIELVGDLASYRPDAKLIIFEGENAEFDQRMTTTLFPDLQRRANTVSAGDRQRVRGLQKVLAIALEKGQVPLKVFSIVDADTTGAEGDSSENFEWDVYHIENYLLEPKFIAMICVDIGVADYSNEELVYVALRDCARETMTDLIRHRLGTNVRNTLLRALKTEIDHKAPSVAPALSSTILRTAQTISQLVNVDFNLMKLQESENSLRAEFESSLAADTWRKRFKGRDVLRRFVGKSNKTNYEVFRDLIIAKMRDAGFQPVGMKAVIDQILSA